MVMANIFIVQVGNIYFRRRSEPKIEASVVKSEEMDEDEIEEDDENMKPFCCNICARGFHCKLFKAPWLGY